MTGIRQNENDRLVSIQSCSSFAKTIEALVVALERRGMAIHARIDHCEGAHEAGLNLRPTTVFIFGYSEAEVPLLTQSQLLGLELPERILVWQDAEAGVWITYSNPTCLGRYLHATPDLLTQLDSVGTSLTGIALEAGGRTDANMLQR